MKDYVYISDSKVDILWPQIPASTKDGKRSTETKLDLKFVSRTMKTEREVNRITKLEDVCQFISEFGNLGDINEPKEYIAGTLDLRMITGGGLGDNFIYWGGREGDVALGLGGSASNLTGSQIPGASVSHFSYIVNCMRKLLESPASLPENEILPWVTELMDYRWSVPERCEYFAKVLYIEQPVNQLDQPIQSCILATPLFVARAFEPSFPQR